MIMLNERGRNRRHGADGKAVSDVLNEGGVFVGELVARKERLE